MMKLYLLTRILPQGVTIGGYDEAYGFVVRADSEEMARLLIGDGHGAGDEGVNTWLNPERSSCQELPPDGHPGVILRDFLNG